MNKSRTKSDNSSLHGKSQHSNNTGTVDYPTQTHQSQTKVRIIKGIEERSEYHESSKSKKSGGKAAATKRS